MQNFLKNTKLEANKRLSQNFLLKNEFIDIFQSSLRVPGTESVYEKSLIVELGAGLAPLSRRILKSNPKKLISIEIDERFAPILERSYPEKFDYIIGDAQNHDHMLEKIKQKAGLHEKGSYPLIQIVGNLPFAIAGRLLVDWSRHSLEKSGLFGLCDDVNMSLIFSENVGEKLLPTFNKRTKFSSITQTAFDASLHHVYPSKAFNPVPKCNAMGLTFTNRKANLFESEKHVQYYFNWMSDNYKNPNKSASKIFSKYPSLKEYLQRLEIKPLDRLFQIPLYKLVKISNFLYERRQRTLKRT